MVKTCVMRAVILLLLFLSMIASAQPATLERDTKKLYEAFDTIDIDAIAEMMCNRVGAEAFKTDLDQWFQNDDFKFRFVYTNAKYEFRKMAAAGEVFEIGFRNVVRITYFKPVDAVSKKEELQKMFHAQSATFDKARNCFLIVYKARLIAAAENDTWKFTFADATVPEKLSANCPPENLKVTN